MRGRRAARNELPTLRRGHPLVKGDLVEPKTDLNRPLALLRISNDLVFGLHLLEVDPDTGVVVHITPESDMRATVHGHDGS